MSFVLLHMETSALAALLASVVLLPTGFSLTLQEHCTCYDTFTNFLARANDQYKDAVADRLRRERGSSGRAALQQIRNQMLQSRDPASQADMAATSDFTCQVRIGK